MVRRGFLLFGSLVLGVLQIPGPLAAEPIATPEAALLALEDAYRNGDIEAAVSLKDFAAEARLMGKKLGVEDQDLNKEMAETFELMFRSEIKENGFPDFSELTCSVATQQEREPGIVALAEVCRDKSGEVQTQQILLASKTGEGWRIIGLEDP